MTPPSIKDVARLAEVSIGTVSKGVPVILVDQASSRGELPWCSVGVDDFAAGTSVPLTTVAQPRHEIGRMALQLLEEEVAAGIGRCATPPNSSFAPPPASPRRHPTHASPHPADVSQGAAQRIGIPASSGRVWR